MQLLGNTDVASENDLVRLSLSEVLTEAFRKAMSVYVTIIQQLIWKKATVSHLAVVMSMNTSLICNSTELIKPLISTCKLSFRR